MWLEITDKVIDLPGIFIIKDNPITIGAWSMLPTQDRFVLWIHKKRHTAKLLKNDLGAYSIGEKCTFSITDDLNIIHYCGHVSGRSVNKLEKIPTIFVDGYRYVSPTEYTVLLSIENILPIHDFYLVIAGIDGILNFKGGEQWIQVKSI